MLQVLGLSALYPDSAAVLLRDGEIVAAVQEERFTRVKNDPSFPSNAIRYCLEVAGRSPQELDAVVFYDKPILKFDRLLKTALGPFPKVIQCSGRRYRPG